MIWLYSAENASPRPWRVEHVTRQGEAVVKAANGEIVAVCHADNARLIVEAVDGLEDE